MAIALDTTSSNEQPNDSTTTHAHTCTGTNLCIVVLISVTDATAGDRVVSSVTYGGDALTHNTSAIADNGSGERVDIWYKLGPKTGANNVAQVGQPDAIAGIVVTVAEGPLSESITTVADNCWTVSISQATDTSYNGVSGITQIASTTGGWNKSGYAGPKTPAGAVAHTYTLSSGTTRGEISLISLSPAAVSAFLTGVTFREFR
jgi:hypothetical protein